jgi:peptide-methionine (S)-S-oxide reductase
MGEGPLSGHEFATLGGGCFWCLEAVFLELQGIHGVVSGYCGGVVDRPAYQEVCSGATGHAEVVQIAFDPAVLSYRELLGVFFAIHDPTTLNRQGNDSGTQYRSVIFHHSPEQKKIAEEVREEMATSGQWGRPLVTELSPLQTFYPAEDYHQDYYRQNPAQPYCRMVVAPKVDKFRKEFVGKTKKP